MIANAKSCLAVALGLAAAAAAQTLPVPSTAQGAQVLHLQTAVETALRQQPTLLQSEALTGAAEGRAEQARSPLLPQISGSGSAERVHSNGGTRLNGAVGTSGTAGTAVVGRSSTFNFFSFGVDGSQLLWDFGQTFNRFRSANRSVDSARANQQTAQIQAALGARRAFFAARAQHALIGVAEETLANQRKHRDQTEGFVRAGIQPEIALAQARVNLANAEVQLITAQNNYRIAKAQLNQAMGTPIGTEYEVADDELGPVEDEQRPLERLVELAIANRPELLAFERQREAAELTAAAIKGAYGPSLSAGAGVSKSGTALDALGDNWNLSLSLAWGIFQGGLTTGQLHEAQRNVDAAAAQLQGERLQVSFDVEQAQATLEGNRASLGAAGDAVTNARDQLRLAEGRYTAGVGSIIELSDAQLSLTNAEAQLVQAQYNLSSARAQLLAALGRF